VVREEDDEILDGIVVPGDAPPAGRRDADA
jgi:hypothetical protein